MDKNERLESHKNFIQQNKVCLFHEIKKNTNCSSITLRRDIKAINAVTSFTHNGQYITLPHMIDFNEFGIWFFDDNIGFTKFENSLKLILDIIHKSKKGITKESLDNILKIDTRKQIRILLKRNELNRVKLGNKYCYLSDKLAKNETTRIKLLGARELEEYYDEKVNVPDLIAVLKVVLNESRIEIRSIGKLIKKYSLTVPIKKIEQLFLKYDLLKKKLY